MRKRCRKKDPFYDARDVASMSECTGLMPTLPENEEEDEHMAALYAIHDEKTDE